MLEVKSGADGSFTGKLMPGTYTVKVACEDYLDTSDIIMVTDDTSKDYTLSPMNKITVTTTADGAALGNAQVIASKGGKNYTSRDSNSPYTVFVPEAGAYTVSVSRGGYISPATQTATFTAADGETQNLAFELTSDFIYDIFTKEDLIKFSNAIVGSTTYSGKTVNLRANIDMSGVKFVPYSGTFQGTFEGNGYMISNLSISGNYRTVGLFRYVNFATIRNLGVVNCNMKSTDNRAYIGGIVGRTQVKTVIENCYVTGTVGDTVNTGGYAGGIAGWFEGSNLYESRIENCYSNVNLRDNKSQFRDTQLATIVNTGTVVTDVTLKNSYFTMTNYGYYIGGNAATVTGVELQTNPSTIAEKLNANITTAGKEGAWVPWAQSGTGFPSFGAPEYTCKVGELEFISLSAAINYALQNSDAAFVTMIADETLNAPITIPTGKSLTLLAEGDCTISRGTAAAAGGRMFTISGTGTSLTLGAAGGMGNGNSLTFDGKDVVATSTFFYVENGGAMTMYDGMKVTGVVRTGTNYAGAIMAHNAGSVLNIAGGEISGNRIEHTSAASAAGVFVYDATLNLSGGKIINNTGAGIGCTPTATINLSGNPIVKGNILSDGKTARNLYLRNVANVNGALAGGASIGVSHATPPTAGTARPFAVGSGYTLTDTDLTRFTSDANGFELRKNASDQFELFINVQYTLTVNGGAGGGQYSEGETVTITADAPSSDKQFKEWTVSPTVTFTEGSATTATAKFTMPNEAVTATATYKGDTGGLDMAFKYLIGEYYSMDLSKKSKTAKYAKMKRGEYQSKICCYGYKKGSDGRLEIDEEAAQTVKLIFDLSLQGNNAHQIMEVLYKNGIPTPGEYKAARGNHTHDISRCHHVWQRSTVLKILNDERYIGTYIMGKRTVTEVGGHRLRLKDESEWFKIPDHHPAIIDKTLFEQVQAQLVHGNGDKKKVAIYPLRSKVFCGCCGHGMTRVGKNNTFVCRFSKIDASFDCHGLKISERELETVLFEIISKQAQVILNLDSLVDTHDIKTKLSEKTEYAEQIAKYQTQKKKLYEAYSRKEIDLVFFTEQNDKYSAELTGLKQKFTALSMQTTQAQKSSAEKTEIRKLAETIAGESRLTSPLTDALLDRVVVYPDKHLEIVWKLKDFCSECI